MIFFVGDVLETSDELSSAFNKYNLVILHGQTASRTASHDVLLNFDAVDIKSGNAACRAPMTKDRAEDPKSSIDVLCDIFTASNIPDGGDVLQPISVLKCGKVIE